MRRPTRTLPVHLAIPLAWMAAGLGLAWAGPAVDEPIAAHSALPPPAQAADLAKPSDRTSSPSDPSDEPSAPDPQLGLIVDPGGLTAFPLEPAGGRPPRAASYPDYPLVDHPRTRYFLERFTGMRREVIERWLARATRYLDLVQDIFRRHGLPEELAFTAMIESGFDPFAVSRAGAKGIWQFMSHTARRYGLRVDQWVDERLDPVKSTTAAAVYLRDLHKQFGSWFLAQAAYNAGGGRVTRAIRLARSSDFWDLAETDHLRDETKDFVPAIQAITRIGLEPDRYGFEWPEAQLFVFDTVRVPPLTDLRRLARAAGLPADTLAQLNPELRRGATPPRGYWDLKVPEGSVEDVRRAALKASRAARAPAGVHIVRPNDTISGIAKKYGVAARDLVRWNKLANSDRIRPGDRILVGRVEMADAESGEGAFR